MDDFTRGTSATLTANFFTYPGGVLADVTGLTITVVEVSTNTAVLGPTAVGIQHPAVGTYTYVWNISANAVPGLYVVVWNGLDNTSQPVQASEIVNVVTDTSFQSGPCQPWEPIWCGPLPTGAASVSGDAVQMATEVLWRLSGQRFGLCRVTIRPCRRECADGWLWFNDWWPGVGSATRWSGGGPRPWWYNGMWYNVCNNGCGNTCSCTNIDEALLPAPARDVVQVKLDGQVMSPSLYRVDENRLLVRLDGGLWPLCQDMSVGDDQPGTWSVTLTVGEDVPILGRRAVGELATEFIRDCLGEECAVPYDITSLSRQGVNISFGSPNEIDPVASQLGLKMVNLFLGTYNPNRLARRSRTYDVERPFPWRRVDTS